MIRMIDASKLAFTKLRTRRIRLGITVFISALIFSALAASSFISNGVFHSIESFSEEGFGSRYIMSASSIGNETENIYENESVLDRAEELQKKEIAEKKAMAKKLGITYDPVSEPQAIEQFETPEGKQRTLNPDSPAALQAISEYNKKNPSPGLPELKQAGEKYQAGAYFESIGLPYGPSMPNLAVLKDGKEEYTQKDGQNFNPFQAGTDSFTGSWQLMSQDLLQPFLLPNQSAETESNKEILPVVAPYTTVEQLLGLKPLPADADAKSKMDRIKQVRTQADNLEFSVCYRNKTSSDLLNQTISTKQELEVNKNKKDYQKPSLIYDLPEKPCGPVVIQTDKRTFAEKKLAEKEETFKKAFGEEPPKQTILRFKVVGIGPDPPDITSFNVSGILSSLLSSNLGGQASWLTPIETRENQELLKTLFPEQAADIYQPTTYYAEFPSAETASNFAKKENCEPDYQFASGPVDSTNANDPYAKCKEANQYFYIYPFGSNSLALEDAKKGFAKVFKIAAMVITAIAAIILIGTVGRVIADSRRETAVFRAIGAKRLDIAQIYFTYTVFLSLLVAGVALLIGFIAASIANSKYSEDLTVAAILAYNSQDLNREFNLYGLDAQQLFAIIGLIVLAGLASAVLPLLTNVRRNPINDMRDEN